MERVAAGQAGHGAKQCEPCVALPKVVFSLKPKLLGMSCLMNLWLCWGLCFQLPWMQQGQRMRLLSPATCGRGGGRQSTAEATASAHEEPNHPVLCDHRSGANTPSSSRTSTPTCLRHLRKITLSRCEFAYCFLIDSNIANKVEMVQCAWSRQLRHARWSKVTWTTCS